MQLPKDTSWPVEELLNSEVQFSNILRMGMQFQVHLKPASTGSEVTVTRLAHAW